MTRGLARVGSGSYPGRVKRLSIDVWSDIACPWCYVGKRRLEAALARFPQRDQVAVRWHAFELDPSAPKISASKLSHAAELAQKYGTSVTQAEAMIGRLVDVARGEGLDFRFDKLKRGNTFDAHRLVRFAETRGAALQAAMTERLMRAYLTEGATLGEPETLVGLAVDVGLDADEVRAMLADGTFTEDVRADEQRAQASGITGVPCFVLDWKYGVTGAQTADVLLKNIERAWSELPPAPIDMVAEGDACGPDGCN